MELLGVRSKVFRRLFRTLGRLGVLSGLVIGLFILLLTVTLAANSGDLDPTFGNGGIVTTMTDGSSGNSVALQADGKIVVAGYIWNVENGSSLFGLARYRIDGNLDNNFGNSGLVTTTIGEYASGAAVAIQADGKIVVAGSSIQASTETFALARYNLDGSLDSSFGYGGIVTTTIGKSASARAIAIQSDQKIVVAGSSSGKFVVARYHPNGSLDGTFGFSGIAAMTQGTGGEGKAVAIQTDNKIVVVGQYNSQFKLIRYNTNGSLDSTFDSDGVVTTQIGDRAWGNDVTLQRDGRIVVAGTSEKDDIDAQVVARYNLTGSLDSTFGNGGIVTTILPDTSIFGGNGVALSSGKIIVIGTAWYDNFAAFGVVRYKTDGSLDSTFGNGGIVITSFDSFAFGNDIVVQPDGKIIGVGALAGDTSVSFTLARYLGDPPHDIYLPLVFKK